MSGQAQISFCFVAKTDLRPFNWFDLIGLIFVQGQAANISCYYEANDMLCVLGALSCKWIYMNLCLLIIYYPSINYLSKWCFYEWASLGYMQAVGIKPITYAGSKTP